MNKVVPFVLLLPLLAAASSHANNPEQNLSGSSKLAKSSKIVYIDVAIVQLDVEECFTTSLNEGLKTNELLIIYPNPVQNRLNIELSEASIIKHVRVIDLLGHEVIKMSKIENSHYRLAVDQLNTGMYFIQVFTDDNMFVSKFQITR